MLQSIVPVVFPEEILLPMSNFLVCWMCHCISEICILEELKKEKAVWIHYVFDVLRTLPILEVLEIPDKCLILKVAILR